MLQIDQALRDRISYDLVPGGVVKESALPRIFQQMIIVDRVNTGRLHELIQSCGWPKKSIQGEQAVGAAWLLAQHANKEAQRGFLPFLDAAVKAGEASPSDLAYLTDSIAISDGRPQLYGTQLRQLSPCEFEFEPFDDRTKVNERRKSAGMPSLEEYKQMSHEHFSKHGCPAR